MKKLLIISLFLVSATPAFGASYLATIQRVWNRITTLPVINAVKANYLKQQIRFKEAELLEMLIKNPQTPTSGMGFFSRGVKAPLSESGQPFDVNSDPLTKLAFKTLPELEAELALLPKTPVFVQRAIDKSSPLVVSQILASIPGTQEHKNEQQYPHIAELAKKANLK